MATGMFGGLALRGGLTLAAALMMTTAVFGQDQDDAGLSDPPETVDAVPVEDGGPDIVIDDGFVIGGWPDDPADDGSSDDGTGDDWVDDGTGDDWVDDGTGDDWVDDGTGDDWVDDGTGDDWVDDGTGDEWVDDGSDGGSDDELVDDGSGDGSDEGGVVDDGEVVIYYLDGGPMTCGDCAGELGDLPMEAFQMNAGAPLVPKVDAPVAAKPRRTKSHAVAAGGMAECLADHPQLPWICEWQNSAGQ